MTPSTKSDWLERTEKFSVENPRIMKRTRMSGVPRKMSV